MNKLFVAGLAMSAAVVYADVDIDVNVSLGSEIGSGVSADEVMPFWGQAEVGYSLGGLTPYAVYGHTSSADINANGVEYHGEYYGAGASFNLGLLYASAQVVKYAENNFERETDAVQMYELGLNTELRGVPFRVVGFYEHSPKGYIERAGLKFGYEFDIK